MAYTTINKPTDYFNTKLWTGNGGTQSITGVGFQPDLVWSKGRTLGGYNHYLIDSVRGSTKPIHSNLTDAEYTDANSISSFNSDGYTFGTSNGFNNGSNTYVGWNWKANGAGSANTDGSISSTVSANTTSGFSIVSYTGTGANATVGHGLGSAPTMIIVKNINSTNDWNIGHSAIGWDKRLFFNTNAESSGASWNSTAPTSSVFSIGTAGATNTSSNTHVAYCFAEKTGYSKFGSYTGNGNADGTFVYTGFKPAWIMYKDISGTSDWYIMDTKRRTFNVTDVRLEANNSDAEVTGAGDKIDILSNGFKFRHSSGSFNISGNSYIYMSFAEEPLVGDNPCTAR